MTIARHSLLARFVFGAVAVVVTAAMAPSVVSASSVDSYTVQGGDTLTGIASELNIPLDALLVANGLTTSSLIVPGQQLTVPATASHGLTYQVSAGDTLSGVAASHAVSLESLLAVNSLTADSLITPGMQLRLPDDATNATTGSAHSGGTVDVPATHSRIDTVLDYALSQAGKPYVFFTNGPSAYDCSGLTMAAYAQIGVSLVHQSAGQSHQGTAVDFWNSPIRAGDLVFLDGDWNGVIDHVGIALGPSTWVQASESHGQVLTSPVPDDSVIIAVRRFINA